MGLAFDEGMLKAMSDYIIAVNRLKHAQANPASLPDPTRLRQLAAEESQAEERCLQALEQRGWAAPFRALRMGA
jgi:hypothetical protein